MFAGILECARRARRPIFCALLLSLGGPATAGDDRLRLATTTSTDNSGLLAELHPPFERAHGVSVDVIAVGTGKALRLGANGDVDVVLVHAPAAEQDFVAAGYGVARVPVMHNDFVILGPEDDPAGVRDAAGAPAALAAIAAAQAPFVSRGDDSGTHKKELELWAAAGLEPAGDWYLATGQGMGTSLRIADDKGAYVLSDRGTWLAFKDKLDALAIVHAGDATLHNPYHVIAVNPERHPHVNADLARAYIDYLVSPAAQAIIGGFTVGGEELFIPDAR